MARFEDHEDWKRRSRGVAVALFAMSAAFVLTKTGRDALYFQGDGLFDLPKAYIGIAMLALPTAFAMLGLMRGLGARAARVVAPLLAAASLAAFQGFARPGGGPAMTAFFLLVPLVFGVLFSGGWLLTAELLEGAARHHLRRAYALAGAASIGGATAAALAARFTAAHVEPNSFLGAGAVFLVLSATAIALAHRRWPPTPVPAGAAAQAPGLDDFRAVLGQRYTMLLLTVAMLAGLVGVLVEFQFYLAATLSGNDGRQNAVFFSNFYLVLNGLALVAQLWVTPSIQRRFGVHGSLFVLPIALVAGAGALLASATVVTRALLRVAEGGIKSSVHRSNWEQAYLPLGRAQRAAAKLLVDGAGARMAEGFAALILFLWLRTVVSDPDGLGASARWMTWALAATGFLWVAFTAFLGRSLKPAESRFDHEAHLELPIPDS